MSWKAKFADACQLTFSEQAKFWLNGFWQDGAEGDAEEIWELAHKFIECDLGEPVRYGSRMKEYKETCDLDELKSHVVLEWLGNVLTIVELRKRLKKLDIDNNKRMALLEYLLDKYDRTPEALMAAPQPDVDPAVLQAAQDAFAAAGEALYLASSEKKAAQAAAAEAARRLAQSEAASVEAAEALVMAEKAKQEAEVAHAKQEAAEAEVQAAVDEITALEKARSDKLAKLDAIINDSSIGQVKRARSANEKEQLLGEDELPLRKAKITQKAALKRVAVATAAAANVLHRADAAKAASAKAKSAADQAEAVSKEAKAAADRAAIAAEKAHEAAIVAEKEAEAKLEEIKNSSGPPWGPIFWMERTLKEKKKFMK